MTTGADSRSSTSRWMDLFFSRATCFLMWSSKTREWELLWDHSQETGQTSHIHMEIQFVQCSPQFSPPPPNTQEDLPQVTSQMQPFRAPQGGSDPVLGEGKDLTQRVFSGPELEVQRDTCLWLWTPGRAHRNCCWMWAPSRCCKAKETWTQEGCV